MMRYFLAAVLLVTLSAGAAAGEELGPEKQWEIVQGYMIATGQTDKLESVPLAQQLQAAGALPGKCGTPAVTEFVLNRDKIDPELLKSLGSLIEVRPTGLNQTLASPSGRFLIHYTTQGTDAIPGSIPNYADSVARIFDDVYAVLVQTLGYPNPPTDEFYPEGGTSAFDVYLLNLGSVYGLTYIDYYPVPGTVTSATAFMELENDYVEISAYRNRPLDAVRVTAAHEFFHAVQFGIDYTEGTYSAIGPYWMEMSATWSEELNYDGINDYYYYLPEFFVQPWTSIGQFDGSFDLHPYASVLFPLYLSQVYDPDIIRDIWFQCRDLGPYSDDFLEAANDIIGSYSGGSETFASAFNEFVLWNYFTGSRASMAPDGVGYEEAAAYDEFLDYTADSVIAIYRNYEDSIVVDGPDNPFNPEHNAAFYFRLENLYTVTPDTTFWICTDGFFPTCNDSSQVIDTSGGYDIMHVDSTLSVSLDLDGSFPGSWGLNIIRQLDSYPDSSEIEQSTLPYNFSDFFDFYYSDFSTLRSLAFVLTPASANRLHYHKDTGYQVAYEISTEQMLLDPSLANAPAAVLAPYPNPAVVSALDGAGVTFRFQIPTDENGIPLYGERYSGSSPSLYVDIYNVAGERVCTLDEAIALSDYVYETVWDLKNAEGEDIASGVYVAYARLYADSGHGQLIAQEKTKVLVVR